MHGWNIPMWIRIAAISATSPRGERTREIAARLTSDSGPGGVMPRWLWVGLCVLLAALGVGGLLAARERQARWFRTELEQAE